jgi:hypothetical protein
LAHRARTDPRAANNLRVVPVLDLDPRWIARLFRVPALAMLGNDPFEIALTNQFKQLK